MRKIAFLLTLVFMISMWAAPTKAQDIPTLWLSPQLDYVAVGSEVLVLVKVTDAPFTYGTGIQVIYDSSYLEIDENKVIEGDFFRNDGASTAFAKRVVVNGKNGRLAIGISRFNDPQNSYGPTAGSGLVCYFSVKTKFVGEAALGLKDVYLTNLVRRQGEEFIEQIPCKLEETKIVVRAKDNQPPNVTIIKNPPPETNNFIGEFCWAATDDSSPSSKIQYAVRLENPIKGGEWSQWMDRTCYAFSFTNEGKNIFCVKARDEWGNVSQPACYTVNLDITPPKLELSPIPQETKDETYTVCGLTDKPETGVMLTINGARVPINAEGAFCFPIRLIHGPTNVIHVAAIDRAGNIEQKVITITLLQETVIILSVGIPEASINGEKKIVDPPPQLIKGRTFVPLKFISDAFGYNITYEATDKRIEIAWTEKIGDQVTSHLLRLWIGKTIYNLDGKTMFMDVPPQIVKGRTMVPIRFIANAFGAQTDWDSVNRRVTIKHIRH